MLPSYIIIWHIWYIWHGDLWMPKVLDGDPTPSCLEKFQKSIDCHILNFSLQVHRSTICLCRMYDGHFHQNFFHFFRWKTFAWRWDVGYINHIDKKFFYYFSQVQPTLMLAVEILILVIECTTLVLARCVLIQSKLLLGGTCSFFHTRANVPSWCKFLITYMKTWN